MRSAVSCRWFRTVSAFTVSPSGNTSFSKSFALANGIKDAHFVSRYSISGLVCPLRQVLIGRNVWGPSVWQPQRFHRGLGTSTRPNTMLTGVLPEALVVYRLRQCGQARRCSNSSRACWATTKSCTPANNALLSSHAYLLWIRLSRAREMLKQPGRAQGLKEIAGSCGFFDQTHFGRHFRRMFGTMPAAFARVQQRLSASSRDAG